jgi:F-type H+-transporting ATPase subunit delta
MAKSNHSSAVSYARSLLDLANARGQAEPIGSELSELRQVLIENRSFQQFLADPAVSHEQRAAAVKKIFSGRVHPLVTNLLGVMNDKGRLGLLGAVCDAYDELLEQQLGKVEVDVTVASRLSPDELEQVRQRISAALKRDAVVHQYVDESIIGGIIIRVQDQLIDGSVRRQLEMMRRKMLAGRK